MGANRLMDTIQHTVQGCLITLFVTDNIPLIITGGIIGGVLDVIGKAEKVIKKDDSAWSWYNRVHALSFKNPFVYLPQSLLHILLDKLTHTETCKWWKGKCIALEILGWLITIVIVLQKYNWLS